MIIEKNQVDQEHAARNEIRDEEFQTETHTSKKRKKRHSVLTSFLAVDTSLHESIGNVSGKNMINDFLGSSAPHK